MNEEQTPGAAPPQSTAVTGDVPTNERTMGMLCHLSAFAGYIVPFGNFIGPLIIWLMKKEEMPFVDDQGKESLNFQITVTIAMIVSAVLVLVVIGVFLMIGIGLASLIFMIIAAVKANSGEHYRYPLTIRFIK